MPLSPSTIADLTSERASLVKRRQDIDERLAAIDLLLRRPITVRVARRPTTPPAAVRGTSEQPALLPFNGEGVRGAIRRVLERGAAAPGEAIRTLKDGGFSVAGKTPLAVRVYNELKRMKDDGLVAKNGDGKYALVGKEE